MHYIAKSVQCFSGCPGKAGIRKQPKRKKWSSPSVSPEREFRQKACCHGQLLMAAPKAIRERQPGAARTVQPYGSLRQQGNVPSFGDGWIHLAHLKFERETIFGESQATHGSYAARALLLHLLQQLKGLREAANQVRIAHRTWVGSGHSRTASKALLPTHGTSGLRALPSATGTRLCTPQWPGTAATWAATRGSA